MLVSVCRCTRSTQRASRGSSRLGSFAQDEATETHLVLLGERLVRGRLEEEHAPGDVDDGRAGHLAQRLSERERLGRKDVAVAVVRACEGGARLVSWCGPEEEGEEGRRDAPAMAVKHSSSGRALRWLHMRRSKPLATSMTSCASSPRLYSACMQHWVITAREEVEVREVSELLVSEERRRRRRGRTRLDDTL